MKNEKNIEPKELTDEQLKDVAGGANFQKISETCSFCRLRCHSADVYTVKVDGVMRKVCRWCLKKLDKIGDEYTAGGKI